MMILNYKSKKEMREHIGEALNYTETSIFGPEYRETGVFCGCNRPYSPEYPKFEQRKGREFFAEVVMKTGFIDKVR